MNEVEILASTEIVKDIAFNWGAFWKIYLSVVFASFIVGVIIGVLDGEDLFETFIITIITMIGGIIVGALIGFIGGAMLSEPLSHTSEHKVILSDDVSMNEFTDKYEIVDQEGRIYTVREKDWCEK